MNNLRDSTQFPSGRVKGKRDVLRGKSDYFNYFLKNSVLKRFRLRARETVYITHYHSIIAGMYYELCQTSCSSALIYLVLYGFIIISAA